jgi:DNA-damage-inducible protein D
MTQQSISLFEQQNIRKVWHNDQWFFILEDVILALTSSTDPKQYIKKMKSRDLELNKGWVQIVPTLWVETAGWRQKMNCANAEWIFRIIQSIPSPKAEPFKLWLAKVWYERIQEIEDPELAQQRMKHLYETKWYPKDWIDKRLRWIAVRQQLTDEWKQRWASTSLDYAILTNEIMQAAFGMTVQEYKDYKNLDRENLRDHMGDLELILTMLWEATTTKFHQDRDSHEIGQLKQDAQDGWNVAGRARQDIERQGKKVISKDNYLWLSWNHSLI